MHPKSRELAEGGQVAALMDEERRVSVSSAAVLGALRGAEPREILASASAIATPLRELVESRKLYADLKGAKYVRCEGWTTLAAMLGVTPHEVEVTERDGVYTAVVELRRISDGRPIARASAECGAPDELDRDGNPTWASRPRYARRSMALTRATAKACRLAFSWIMVLAGYEPTPAEELVDEPPAAKPAARPRRGADAAAEQHDSLASVLAEFERLLKQFPPAERDRVVREVSRFTKGDKEYALKGVADLRASTEKRLAWLKASLTRLREMAEREAEVVEIGTDVFGRRDEEGE